MVFGIDYALAAAAVAAAAAFSVLQQHHVDKPQPDLQYTVMLKRVAMIIFICKSFFRHTDEASVNCHIQFGTNQIFHYAVT